MNGSSEEPIASLLERFAGNFATFLREEWALARAEMKQKAASTAVGVAMIVLAVGMAVTAGVLLITAAVLGLATAMPGWMAALLMAVVVLLGAVTCAAVAVGLLRRQSLRPSQTIAWAREDVRWLTERLR